MFTITQRYLRAESLPQAYETLVKNRNSRILGGGMWMRQSRKRISTLIDLSALGLDTIQTTENGLEIGCMTTLRQLETSPLLQSGTQILATSVQDIVGVQFRNTATVGGSLYGRFGFSDVLTACLVLDTTVHLHHGGAVSLEDFCAMAGKRDILEKISNPLPHNRTASYQSIRRSATDFPVLALAISKTEDTWRIAVGARPHRAALAHEAAALLSSTPTQTEIDAAAVRLLEELRFDSNLRASEDYRRDIAPVLLRRGMADILSKERT